MTISLQLNNIAKRQINSLFSQVNLQTQLPSKIALIGDNGIGKSTLLRIIANQDSADEGTIIWQGDPKISYLPQEIITNEYSISGGQQKILLLSEIFYGGSDVILLDEPDNHLDLEHREWFSELVEDFDGLLIVISHDRHFLRKYVNTIWLIEDQQVQSYPGAYDKYLELYTQKKEYESNLYHTQLREQQRLKEQINRLKTWVKLSDKFAGRYRSLIKKYDRHGAEMISKPITKKKIKLDVNTKNQIKRKTALQLEHISKSYDSREVIQDANLHLFCGEKVAIIAPNGSGKTTLLRIISGDLTPTAGSLRIGNELKLGVYAQDHLVAIDENTSPIDTLRNAVTYSESQAVGHLAQFLFSYDQMRGKTKFLSGGQKSRLQLACFLATNPDILILDEPTNHLDITTVQLLEDFLKKFPGAILLVSHDREFVDGIVDRLVQLKDGQLQSIN